MAFNVTSSNSRPGSKAQRLNIFRFQVHPGGAMGLAVHQPQEKQRD